MSKITFRADDDLVDRVEALDGSKSQIMREALREYLDDVEADHDDDFVIETDEAAPTLDNIMKRRVDAMVKSSLDEFLKARLDQYFTGQPQDVNVNIALDTPTDTNDEPSDVSIESATVDEHACNLCGHDLEDDHVFCPNCGEKATLTAFCECGDELNSDWAFCPNCGRRTPAGSVLDNS